MMHAQRIRPLVVAKEPGTSACAVCGLRHQSVCTVIEDQDLGRLAAAAEHMEFPRHLVFVEEGAPADAFFNIVEGSMKLYKLPSDGRRQITGFASVGYFLGLAVSTAYAFSAESIEPVRA